MFLVYELKARYQLSWEDLPYVENPVSGLEHAMNALAQRHDYFGASVHNIEEFKRDYVPYYHREFNHDIAENELHYKFLDGQLFSVARNGDPFSTTFKWRELDNHPDGGEWYVCHPIFGDVLKQQLENHAKQLGAQRRKWMAERAEIDANPAALIPAVRRVVEKSVVEKPISTPVKGNDALPQSLDEAAQRLIDAGPAVRAARAAGSPLPPSAYSLADKQAVIAAGLEERFLVRVIETDYASDEGYIGKVREHGQSISWTAPFSMVEHGDTDAEALLNAFGTRHTLGKKYTVLIIDRDKMNEIGDVQTIIPTKQNLRALIAENPHISTLSPDEVEQVLSDDLAPKYYLFAKAKSKKEISSEDIDEMEALSNDLGFSKDDTQLIIKRQKLAGQVAAWEEFTGNGMTLDTNSKAKAYGPVEVVMLDKKPMKLGQLRNDKAVKSINC